MGDKFRKNTLKLQNWQILKGQKFWIVVGKSCLKSPKWFENSEEARKFQKYQELETNLIISIMKNYKQIAELQKNCKKLKNYKKY